MTMRAKRVRPVFCFALAAVIVWSCRDAAGPAAGTGYFSLAPSFASAAAGIVEIGSVRVRLLRGDESVALDTTVTVPTGADSLELELTVRLNEPNEVFQMFLDFITPAPASVTVFRAGPVEVTPSAAGAEPVPIEVEAVYVGVGANAASVVITTARATVLPGQTTQLSAEARDAGGQPIAGTPIAWASLDPARATVPDPAEGAILGGTTPGPVSITATLLTGQADTISVDVQPAPELLVQVGGDGQTAPGGSELPLPLIVEVIGADLPIEGASVLFTTGDGGSFSADSVVTGANGRAQTMWTLGPGTGTQTATATVSGFTSVTTTFSATAALGITLSWNNAGGGSWSDPANWTPNQVPGAADTVVIDLDGTYTVTLGTAATVSVLTMGGVSGLQTLALSSNTLTLNGNSTIGVAGAVDLNGASLAGTGSLFSAGVMRVSGGVAVIDLALTNTGSLDVQAGGLELAQGGTSSGMISTATGTSTSVSGGTLDVTGGSMTADGSLAVLAGATVRFSGATSSFSASSSVSGGGDIDFAGGPVTLLGGYSVTGTSSVSGGTMSFENTTTPATTANLTLSSGTLSGAGDVSVSGTLLWSGGTMDGGGLTSIGAAGGGTLDGGAKVLDGRVLSNEGNTVWTAGNIDARNGAAITNAASGTLDVQAPDGSVLDNTVGAAALTNDGMLAVASDGFVSVNVDVVNNGTIDVLTGALDLNGSFTHADGAVLQGTATLNLIDATVTALDGDVNPGTSPGALGINGDLPLSALSTVNLELNGLTAGSQYDQLNISGVADLSGVLDITAGFTPQPGDAFTVMTFASRAGVIVGVNGLDLGGGVILDTVWGANDLTLVVQQPKIVFAGDSSGGLSTGIFTVDPDASNLARVQDLIPLGFERQYPRWSPDRSRIAYSWDGGAFGPLKLYVTNKLGSAVQEVVNDTSTFQPRWSPNGVHLAFECGDGFSVFDVCVIGDVTGPIGSLPVNTYAFASAGIINWSSGRSGFSWDPQNPDRLVFARDSGAAAPAVSMLWTANYDGTGVQRLAPDGLLRPVDSAPLLVVGPLDFSPDGQQIVFAAYSPADAIPEDKLFVINRDGTGLRQLTFQPGYDDSPLYSPDGTEVLFGRELSCSYDGWIVDINNTDGTLERRITDEQFCDFDLDLLGGDWSPDGTEIVLTGRDPLGNLLIYVVPRTVTPASYLADRKLVGRGVDLGGFVQDIQPSWRP